MTSHAPPRDHSNFVLAAVSLAGTSLGQGTALVDEDVLRVLLLDAPSGEKALQLRYDSITGVASSEDSVIVSSRDGRALVVVTADAAAFRLRVLAACRALPEVTRALGSRR